MKRFLILIVCLIITFLPYSVNDYSAWRVLALALGLIAFTSGLVYGRKQAFIKGIAFLIIASFGLYFLDLTIYRTFDIMPVLVWPYESAEKVKTYDSFTYRIYDCDGNLTFDDGYKLPYACDNNAIEKMSINKFLENPAESFKEYKNKFVHLEGKINSISGNTSIGLNAYDNALNPINGYVVFDNEKMVLLGGLTINPSDYYIYDYIEFIALVDDYQNLAGKQTIYLKDAVIIPNDIYKNPEVVANEDYTNSLKQIVDNLYYAGISSIYYRFNEENVYEFEYLLLDKRESIDNLIKDVKPEVINENEDKLYKLDKFQIIRCQNHHDVIASNRIYYFDNICD